MSSATDICIKICKLQFASAQPCLHVLCSLMLPEYTYTEPASVFMDSEWIPTSNSQDRTGSQTPRRRPFPFRSRRAGTIGLILRFQTRDKGVLYYVMFISVDALFSFVHSGVSYMPWFDWGLVGTRILPLGKGILPRPAGPFWITSYAPLVVHDYNSLRARYIKKQKKSTRTSSIPPQPSLGPPSTEVFGDHWGRHERKTYLPFRKLVTDGLFFKHVVQVVADREWIVVIARTVRRSMFLHS